MIEINLIEKKYILPLKLSPYMIGNVSSLTIYKVPDNLIKQNKKFFPTKNIQSYTMFTNTSFQYF